MHRVEPHKEQRGFLTIAQNNETTDYLSLAYVQAMSVKLTMPGSKFALLVDRPTLDKMTFNHHDVFDYVILIPEDDAQNDEWKLANEWKVFYLTPFKETIKLESDIVFTRSIEHWWKAFRMKNLVLSTGCKDYLGNPGTSRKYRQIFDDNELPDLYSGLMYFRFSQEATRFFQLAQQLFQNWEGVSSSLQGAAGTQATTDVVYALAAKIIGVEECTLPTLDFINFTHMKPAINDWQNSDWTNVVPCELDLPMVRINGINQYHPLHYYAKNWVTPEVIERYEQCLTT